MKPWGCVAVLLLAPACIAPRCSAHESTYLDGDSVARIAVAFCAAVGIRGAEPTRVIPPAKRGVLASDAHHWRSLWHIAMRDGAVLQIADVSGIVVGYTSGRRSTRPLPPREPVSQEEAVEKAVILLAASGQKNELADSPDISDAIGGAAWDVRWKRLWNGVPYPDDCAIVSIDKASGEARSLFVNFKAPSPEKADEAVTAQEAVNTAQSALSSKAGSNLQVLPPEKLVVTVPASSRSHSINRVAWHCRFLTASGQVLQTYIDIVTGQALRIAN